ETKQPITDKLSAIGCIKGVLIPVSKTGVSPSCLDVFCSHALQTSSSRWKEGTKKTADKGGLS
ncbi:hypothetical protein ACTHPZ_08795, partial [Bacillus halotolerans]|uniref:hypothetical protein n=1 Tax=Bacillus halotolerans TaxID=260554 RepID=UPI003F7BE1C0